MALGVRRGRDAATMRQAVTEDSSHLTAFSLATRIERRLGFAPRAR